jgi:SAM-dependent methyltransferase
MRPRIASARFLIRLGNFIQSTALIVMHPDDLIEFGRQLYARPINVTSWSRQDLVESGLNPEEQTLLGRMPCNQGRLLLLGLGGGREAVYLARLGFQVAGVDFVPAMVEQAKKNAAQRGLKIEGLVQEISRLDVPASAYDVAWLSAAMYSSVPTRQRRVNMLRRICQALRPGGYFLCQFIWGTNGRNSRRRKLAWRTLAVLTLGNLAYEPGDMLWANVEFIHRFLSEEELRSEFVAGGLELLHLTVFDENMRGGAVLRKPLTEA